jgi:hypothetical protein
VTTITALAMLLRRLAWSCRLSDLACEFGLDTTSTGRIINYIATTIADLYDSHLQLWPGVTAQRIAQYATAITNLTPAVIDTWGFIDGTRRHIARPLADQRSSYNGKEGTHTQNWQAVLTPDGLIVSLYGPFAGSKKASGW